MKKLLAALLAAAVVVLVLTGGSALLRARHWIQSTLDADAQVATLELDNIGEFRVFLSNDDQIMTPWVKTHRTWEVNETHWFTRSVRPGDTVVDLGANFGYYTLIASRLVGDDGRVYAFEPDPANFALLQRNIAVNGLRNVIAEQKAVSNRPGTIQLFLSEENKGDHRISDVSGENRTSIDVEAVTLDDYFAGRENEIDFIKSDTQGAEGLILEGMRTILEKNDHLRMAFEYDPHLLAGFGSDPEKMLDSLENADFRFFDLGVGFVKGPLVPRTRAELESYASRGARMHTNVMLIKGRSQLGKLEREAERIHASLAKRSPNLALAQASWEREQREAARRQTWSTVVQTAATSSGAAQPAHVADGSITEPSKITGEKTTLRFPVGPGRVGAIRIDFLPATEPGSAAGAEQLTVLESIEVFARRRSDATLDEVDLESVTTSTMAQRKASTTAKGIIAAGGPSHAPGARSMLLTLATLVADASHSEVEIQIQTRRGVLGQLRVRVSEDSAPLAPWVVEALDTPPERRSAQQLMLLDDLFRSETPLLRAQREKLQASIKAIDDFQRIE